MTQELCFNSVGMSIQEWKGAGSLLRGEETPHTSSPEQNGARRWQRQPYILYLHFELFRRRCRSQTVSHSNNIDMASVDDIDSMFVA